MALSRRIQADRAGRAVRADPSRRARGGPGRGARRLDAGGACGAARAVSWRWTCCRSTRCRARGCCRAISRTRRWRRRWTAALGGKADLVLSDMAPNTTGHAATDHVRIMALADAALEFAAGGAGRGRQLRRQGVPGRLRAGDAGADEAVVRDGAPRQAAGEPERVERAVRGGAGVQGESVRHLNGCALSLVSRRPACYTLAAVCV